MANINDYLAWRGDISLAYSPFNDLDSLALSLLSYLTFQESGQLRDLAPTAPAVDQNQFSFVHECRSLLNAAALTERFAGITLRYPVAVTDQDKDMQFAAVIYDLPDGSQAVYFLAVDWWNDPEIIRTPKLRINGVHYDVELPFGIMKKALVKDGVAVLCQSESADVLRFTESGFVAQGEGVEEFLIFRDGQTSSVTVDFTDVPQKEVTL